MIQKAQARQMARKKKHGELPGLERPTNEQLDEVFSDWLEAKETAKRAKDAAKDALSTATEKMREVAGQLEEDDNGNPCYLYVDGDLEISIALSSSSKIVSKVVTDGVGAGDDDDDPDGCIG